MLIHQILRDPILIDFKNIIINIITEDNKLGMVLVQNSGILCSEHSLKRLLSMANNYKRFNDRTKMILFDVDSINFCTDFGYNITH